MERQRQTLTGTVLALALALLAAACGGGGDGGTGGGNTTVTRGGVFRSATTDFSFSNGFDPTGEYSARGFNLYGPLLRTLVGYRRVGGPPGNELRPDLATFARTADSIPPIITSVPSAMAIASFVLAVL